MRTKIGILIFPLFCILVSFTALITDPGFTYLLLKDSPKESVPVTKELLAYFIYDLPDDKLPAVFNEDEKSHLKDVKALIRFIFLLHFLSVPALLACSYGESHSEVFKRVKKIVKKGSLLLLMLIAILSLIPFQTLFTHFHYLFFPQGNWMFPADSTLITFYPKVFFLKYAVAIAVNAVAIAGAAVAAVTHPK